MFPDVSNFGSLPFLTSITLINSALYLVIVLKIFSITSNTGKEILTIYGISRSEVFRYCLETSWPVRKN